MYVFVFILEKKKHMAGLQKLSSALFNLFYESIDASCLIFFFNIVKTILLFLYFSNLSYENTFIQAMALIIVSN